MNDPKKLQTIAKYFRDTVPVKNDTGKRARGQFKCLAYLDYQRQAELTMRDAVYDMMDIGWYIAWMAKPKNGSLTADEAKASFASLSSREEAVVDKKGKWDHNPLRVAVHKNDTVTFRDQEVRGRGYEARGQEVKKPEEQDASFPYTSTYMYLCVIYTYIHI